MAADDSIKIMHQVASSEYEAIDGSHEDYPEGHTSKTKVPFRSKVSLLLLIAINLLNYMDRYTISSVLPLIQKYFDIDDKIAGLLQTIFTCSYMVFAPFCGYLGDRYPRKYVMASGIFIWSLMTFLGSMMNKDDFWHFFVIRGLVGIGEASYSTVSPTLIADMFVKDHRTRALSLFYFAIPCGSGLGYVVGSQVTALMNNNWKWALRVTPGFGLICALLCLVVIPEPERGAIEIKENDPENSVSLERIPKASRYLDDLTYLAKVKSFVWATIGTTCVSFVVGSLAFWAPKFILAAEKSNGNTEMTIDKVSLLVGVITFAAGVIGVMGGAEISRRIRHIYDNAEALVCAFGVLAGSPLLFVALYLSTKYILGTWIIVFIVEVLFCLYWVPNADLRLAVIIPTRRSTAEAVQILIQHLLGDATSPFIVGAISDAVKKKHPENPLLVALYITPFFSVLGGAAYLFCSQTLSADKKKEGVALAIAESSLVVDCANAAEATAPIL